MQAVLDVPRVHKVAKSFVHDPHHFVHDIEPMKDEAVIAMNGGKWMELCFPKQDLSSTVIAEPSNYFSPFPGQSQTRSETDLHLRQSTNQTSVTFTLVSLSVYIKHEKGGSSY
jgi:hypothetical protein